MLLNEKESDYETNKKAQLLLVASSSLLLAGCTVQYNENHNQLGGSINYLVVPTQWLLNELLPYLTETTRLQL